MVGSRIPALQTEGPRRLSDEVWEGSEFLQGLPLGPFRGTRKPSFEGQWVGGGGAVRPTMVLKRHPSPSLAPRGWGPRRRRRGPL